MKVYKLNYIPLQFDQVGFSVKGQISLRKNGNLVVVQVFEPEMFEQVRFEITI